MIFGPEVCSVSKPEPLFDARIVDPPCRYCYRRFWTGSFDKMDAYIARLKSKEKRDER